MVWVVACCAPLIATSAAQAFAAVPTGSVDGSIVSTAGLTHAVVYYPWYRAADNISSYSVILVGTVSSGIAKPYHDDLYLGAVPSGPLVVAGIYNGVDATADGSTVSLNFAPTAIVAGSSFSTQVGNGTSEASVQSLLANDNVPSLASFFGTASNFNSSFGTPLSTAGSIGTLYNFSAATVGGTTSAQFASAPEPSTLTACLAAALAIGARRRRRA